MAITARHLTTGFDTPGVAEPTTEAVTPTAGAVVYAFVETTRSTAVPPTSVAGAGLTFSLIEQQSRGANTMLTLWRAVASSPSTGAITITNAQTQSNTGWSIVEFSGVDTDDPEVQVVPQDSSTQQSAAAITLTAFADPANRGFAGILNAQADVTFSPATDYTIIGQANTGNEQKSIATVWRDSAAGTQPGVSWSGLTTWCGIAVELRAADDEPPGPPGEVTVTTGYNDDPVYGINTVTFSPASTTNPHKVVRADDDGSGNPTEPWTEIVTIPATSTDPVSVEDHTARGGRIYHYTVHEIVSGVPGPAFTPDSVVTSHAGGSGVTIGYSAGSGGLKIGQGGAGVTYGVTRGAGGQKISEGAPTSPARRQVGSVSYIGGRAALGSSVPRLVTGVLKQDDTGRWYIEDTGQSEGWIEADENGRPVIVESAPASPMRLRSVAGRRYQVY